MPFNFVHLKGWEVLHEVAESELVAKNDLPASQRREGHLHWMAGK